MVSVEELRTQRAHQSKNGTQYYRGVCRKCGKEAVVPFIITRPILCKECYMKTKDHYEVGLEEK